MRKPKTISDAIENDSSPPAILKAGSVIDICRSSHAADDRGVAWHQVDWIDHDKQCHER
jgi:hypothetical protein